MKGKMPLESSRTSSQLEQMWLSRGHKAGVEDRINRSGRNPPHLIQSHLGDPCGALLVHKWESTSSSKLSARVAWAVAASNLAERVHRSGVPVREKVSLRPWGGVWL